MVVVKFMAPCVVKKAMMKDMIEKKMEVEMLKDMLIREFTFDKIKGEIMKGRPSHKPNMELNHKLNADMPHKPMDPHKAPKDIRNK